MANRESSAQKAADILNQLFDTGTVGQEKGADTANTQAGLTIDQRMQALNSTGVSQIKQTVIYHIPLDLLLDNPFQPREEIEKDAEYWEFVENIKEYKVLGAVPARKNPDRDDGSLQIAWGHRRREGARDAGQKTLPVTIEDLDDAVMAALAAIENIHRKDLTDFELGKLFLNMLDKGWTQEQVAKQVKKDRGFVINRLRLVTSDQDIQAHVRKKPNSLRAVAYLIKVEDPDDRALLYPRLEDGRLTTDDLAGNINDLIELIKKEEESKKHTNHNRDGSSGGVIETPPNIGGEATSSSDMVEHETIRVASAKLRRISNGLQAVTREMKSRDQVSSAEIDFIKDIGKTYKQLCDQLHIDIDSLLSV